MRTKAELDRRVAELLNLKDNVVAEITAHFLREVRESLVEEGGARLDGLGHLNVYYTLGAKRQMLTHGTFVKGERGESKLVDVSVKCLISFRKAAPLREALKKRPVDKKEKSHGEIRRRRASE